MSRPGELFVDLTPQCLMHCRAVLETGQLSAFEEKARYENGIVLFKCVFCFCKTRIFVKWHFL